VLRRGAFSLKEREMCQAYEGEREWLVQRDLAEIKKRYKAHVRGKKKLTDDELLKLAIEKLMLEER
jgi:hypothetical protein